MTHIEEFSEGGNLKLQRTTAKIARQIFCVHKNIQRLNKYFCFCLISLSQRYFENKFLKNCAIVHRFFTDTIQLY